MNKFEALKEFQGWPADWQRLCAEYWIETGDVDPKFVLAFPNQAEKTVLESLSSMTKVFLPFDQPKAEKMAKRPLRNGMRYSRDELNEVDAHVSEGRGPSEVASIMDKKYPRQRTIDAWEKMANRIKKVGLREMLDRAVDVEFK